MTRKNIFIVTIIGLVLLFSIMLIAEQVEKHVKVIKKHEVICCLEGLSEDQEKEVKDIHNKLEQDLLPIESDLEIKQAELKKLMIADKPNMTTIDAKLDEIGVLNTQMEKKRTKAHLKIRSMLPAEQRLQFDKMHAVGHPRIMRKMMSLGDCGDECGGHKKIKIKGHCGKKGGMKWLDDENVTIEIEEE